MLDWPFTKEWQMQHGWLTIAGVGTHYLTKIGFLEIRSYMPLGREKLISCTGSEVSNTEPSANQTYALSVGIIFIVKWEFTYSFEIGVGFFWGNKSFKHSPRITKVSAWWVFNILLEKLFQFFTTSLVKELFFHILSDATFQCPLADSLPLDSIWPWDLLWPMGC